MQIEMDLCSELEKITDVIHQGLTKELKQTVKQLKYINKFKEKKVNKLDWSYFRLYFFN